MTKEQIEEQRAMIVDHRTAIESPMLETILDAAERALVLEDVLAAAKVLIERLEGRYPSVGAHADLCAAIDRAEGR